MNKHIKVSSGKFRLLNQVLQMDPDLIDLEHFEQGQDGNLVHEAISPKTGYKYDVVSLPRSFLLSHLEEFSNYFNRLAMLEGQDAS